MLQHFRSRTGPEQKHAASCSARAMRSGAGAHAAQPTASHRVGYLQMNVGKPGNISASNGRRCITLQRPRRTASGALRRAPARRPTSAKAAGSSARPRRRAPLRGPGAGNADTTQMRRNRGVLTEVERSGCESQQHGIVGMVSDRHDRSPKRLRRRFIASRNRDLTVPSGIPKIPAMSACARSSKNDSSMTRICSAGSSANAERTNVIRLNRDDRRVRLAGKWSIWNSTSISPTSVAPPRRSRRKASMRRLRAIAKIHALAPAPCGIEQRSLPPYRQHRFLRQFLGTRLRGPGSLHVCFHAAGRSIRTAC